MYFFCIIFPLHSLHLFIYFYILMHLMHFNAFRYAFIIYAECHGVNFSPID